MTHIVTSIKAQTQTRGVYNHRYIERYLGQSEFVKLKRGTSKMGWIVKPLLGQGVIVNEIVGQGKKIGRAHV